MKKNTKLLLGAGAVGVGAYLLLRKKDDGAPAGLGLASDFIDPDKYWFAWTWKSDVKKAIEAFAQARGVQLSDGELDAAFEAVNAQILQLHPLGQDKCRAEVGGRTDAETDACFDPILEAWFAAYSSSATSGESVSECAPGTQATGTNADGSLICTPTAGADLTSSGTPKPNETKNADGTTTRLAIGIDGKRSKITTEDTTGKVVKVEKLDDEGMGASTWLLLGGLGVAAYFLLKTDDSRVMVVRSQAAGKAREYGARAAGAASKKLAEYQRRLEQGSGINGLRRGRKARR